MGMEQNLRIKGSTISEYPARSTWEDCRKPPSRNNLKEAVFNLTKATNAENWRLGSQTKIVITKIGLAIQSSYIPYRWAGDQAPCAE